VNVICFLPLQELTVELMAAKLEIEAFVNGTHPDPHYLRYHSDSCHDTVTKQPNIDGFQLLSDGFPHETATKDTCSSACNRHVNGDVITDAPPHVASGTVSFSG